MSSHTNEHPMSSMPIQYQAYELAYSGISKQDMKELNVEDIYRRIDDNLK